MAEVQICLFPNRKGKIPLILRQYLIMRHRKVKRQLQEKRERQKWARTVRGMVYLAVSQRVLDTPGTLLLLSQSYELGHSYCKAYVHIPSACQSSIGGRTGVTKWHKNAIKSDFSGFWGIFPVYLLKLDNLPMNAVEQ